MSIDPEERRTRDSPRAVRVSEERERPAMEIEKKELMKQENKNQDMVSKDPKMRERKTNK